MDGHREYCLYRQNITEKDRYEFVIKNKEK